MADSAPGFASTETVASAVASNEDEPADESTAIVVTPRTATVTPRTAAESKRPSVVTPTQHDDESDADDATMASDEAPFLDVEKEDLIFTPSVPMVSPSSKLRSLSTLRWDDSQNLSTGIRGDETLRKVAHCLLLVGLVLAILMGFSLIPPWPETKGNFGQEGIVFWIILAAYFLVTAAVFFAFSEIWQPLQNRVFVPSWLALLFVLASPYVITGGQYSCALPYDTYGLTLRGYNGLALFGDFSAATLELHAPGLIAVLRAVSVVSASVACSGALLLTAMKRSCRSDSIAIIFFAVLSVATSLTLLCDLLAFCFVPRTSDLSRYSYVVGAWTLWVLPLFSNMLVSQYIIEKLRSARFQTGLSKVWPARCLFFQSWTLSAFGLAYLIRLLKDAIPRDTGLVTDIIELGLFSLVALGDIGFLTVFAFFGSLLAVLAIHSQRQVILRSHQCLRFAEVKYCPTEAVAHAHGRALQELQLVAWTSLTSLVTYAAMITYRVLSILRRSGTWAASIPDEAISRSMSAVLIMFQLQMIVNALSVLYMQLTSSQLGAWKSVQFLNDSEASTRLANEATARMVHAAARVACACKLPERLEEEWSEKLKLFEVDDNDEVTTAMLKALKSEMNLELRRVTFAAQQVEDSYEFFADRYKPVLTIKDFGECLQPRPPRGFQELLEPPEHALDHCTAEAIPPGTVDECVVTLLELYQIAAVIQPFAEALILASVVDVLNASKATELLPSAELSLPLHGSILMQRSRLLGKTSSKTKDFSIVSPDRSLLHSDGDHDVDLVYDGSNIADEDYDKRGLAVLYGWTVGAAKRLGGLSEGPIRRLNDRGIRLIARYSPKPWARAWQKLTEEASCRNDPRRLGDLVAFTVVFACPYVLTAYHDYALRALKVVCCRSTFGKKGAGAYRDVVLSVQVDCKGVSHLVEIRLVLDLMLAIQKARQKIQRLARFGPSFNIPQVARSPKAPSENWSLKSHHEDSPIPVREAERRES